MNTINEEEFDYQAYTKTHPPDGTQIRRGAAARRQRFDAATRRRVIRIDEDVLAEFRQLAPEEDDDEKFINQALREWLAAQNVQELVREELHQMLQTALTSIQPGKQAIPPRRKISKG